MVEIIFESHGTTLDNEAHLSSGCYNTALSELGERQARELGERYKDERIDAAFCSDLERSWRTAELAFTGRTIPIVKDERLRECDYGDFTRHPSKEIDAVKIEYIEKPFPRGESYEQTATRMRAFLKDLVARYEGKRVMIIGHRATQYGLEHWINETPLRNVIPAPWKWQPGWTYLLESID